MAAVDASLGSHPRLLLVVYDDTTIFMNVAFVHECRARGLPFEAVLLICRDPGAEQARPHVSERQLDAIRGLTELVEVEDRELGAYSLAFDLVLLAKLPERAVLSLIATLDRSDLRRPLLVGFSSGLDASPNDTLKNRIFVDLLLANSEHHRRLLERAPLAAWRDRPTFGVGHPFFARRSEVSMPRWDEVSRVYFLHQSVWPSLPSTRHAVFDFLIELAEAFPRKRFFLKLRHLPNENHDNVNQEQHAPSDYFGSRSLPSNLSLDSSTFRETLEHADLYLSVSSSGIIEGWVHGVPGLFVEGFPGEDQDPLSRAIIEDFRPAGLVVDRAQVLRGELPSVDREALTPHFCAADYFDELLMRAAALRAARPRLGRLHRLPARLRFKKWLGRTGRAWGARLSRAFDGG